MVGRFHMWLETDDSALVFQWRELAANGNCVVVRARNLNGNMYRSVRVVDDTSMFLMK